MVDNKRLAELLEEEPETDDPEILKLVLLLANKAMDIKSDSLKKDEEGHLLVKTVNW